MIEECLHTHPAVLPAAAVAMPDARAGELPVTFIALQPGQEIGAQTLRGHCRRAIVDPTCLPAHIFVLAEMPLTALGKIEKVHLCELAAATSTR